MLLPGQQLAGFAPFAGDLVGFGNVHSGSGRGRDLELGRWLGGCFDDTRRLRDVDRHAIRIYLSPSKGG